MNRITRCPACATVYRVRAEQLQAASGWLRCGQCQHIFDSTGLVLFWEPASETRPTHQVPEAADLQPQARPVRDERIGLGDVLEPGGQGAQASETVASFEDALSSFRPSPLVSILPDDGPGHLGVSPEAAFIGPQAAHEHHSRKLWGGLLGLLALVLALQLLFMQRNVLVHHWPSVAPSAHKLCRAMGCDISALQDVDALVIDSSSLVRRSEDFLLSWTLRNTTDSPVVMTALELTLLETPDKPILKKVFLPGDVGAPAVLTAGQTWAGGLSLRMSTEMPFSDYRIVSFYP